VGGRGCCCLITYRYASVFLFAVVYDRSALIGCHHATEVREVRATTVEVYHGVAQQHVEGDDAAVGVQREPALPLRSHHLWLRPLRLC
jgi:hypothetical protein